MSDEERREIPRLGVPTIPGEQAEAENLVWAESQDEPPPPTWRNRLLVPEKWVDDAVSGAFAQYHDDILAAVREELRRRMEDMKSS